MPKFRLNVQKQRNFCEMFIKRLKRNFCLTSEEFLGYLIFNVLVFFKIDKKKKQRNSNYNA